MTVAGLCVQELAQFGCRSVKCLDVSTSRTRSQVPSTSSTCAALTLHRDRSSPASAVLYRSPLIRSTGTTCRIYCIVFDLDVSTAHFVTEMSGNDFLNLIPSHSQWFIAILVPTPRFSLVFIRIPIPFPLVIPISSHSYSRTTTAYTNKYVPTKRKIW